MSKKMTPDIRFKGYTQDWEQRKLGELVNISSAARVHKNEWTTSGVRFFRSSDIISSFKGVENEKAFISHELFEKLAEKSGKVRVDDVLVTGGGSVGVPYLVIDKDSMYFKDADLIWLKNSGIIDGYFLYTYFTTSVFRKYINTISHVGTISHYTIIQVKETPIKLPSKEEQVVIGAFFKKLDDTIALHQDKLVKLKQLKKGYMQLMLPEKDEKIPSLRFANFSQDWEQRKLREVIESELKGKAKAEMTGSENAYLETNYLNGGEISYVNSPSDVDKDDVIILWDGSQAGTVYHGFKGALGSTLKAYKPKESGEFIYHFLKRNQQKIYTNYRTPNIPHVVKTFIDEFYVSIPIFDEQQRISSLFEQLDYTITLHQKKISTLQEIKKIYLQKMFT